MISEVIMGARIMHNCDKTDLRLLAHLQQNAQATNADLGAALNLSASQAGRRRQRLEEAGVITRYTARLDAAQLALDVQAFVRVHLSQHGTEQARSFARLVATQPAITSAWTMTGDADYLLRIYVSDLPQLHRLIHEVLLAHPAVSQVQSQIVMDQLKADAPLPL